MDRATLRKCPFCGRSGFCVPHDPDYEKTTWQVECAASKCPVSPCAEKDYSREEAIAAWNTRPIEDKLRRDNKALLGALKNLCDKLDECEPHINAAFGFAAIHGARYEGPNYAIAHKEARAALAQAEEGR